MSALLELHLIAMFISERIVNPKLSIPVLGSVNSNLCLFRLARTSRGDDFGDGAGLWWHLAVVEFASYRDSVPRFLRIWPYAASPFPSGRWHAWRCRILSRRSSAPCSHHDMEIEPRLSHFAQLRPLRLFLSRAPRSDRQRNSRPQSLTRGSVRTCEWMSRIGCSREASHATLTLE